MDKDQLTRELDKAVSELSRLKPVLAAEEIQPLRNRLPNWEAYLGLAIKVLERDIERITNLLNGKA